MTQEPDIKRWTAKRKTDQIKQIYRGSDNAVLHTGQSARPDYTVAQRSGVYILALHPNGVPVRT